MNITPLFYYNHSVFNFGNKKITNFTKMDLVLSILHGESLESFALRHNCSIGTVKRRKAEWGICLSRTPEYHSRIEISTDDLERSNNPEIQPEEICVNNNCSKPTLERRKKEANIGKRIPKRTPDLSDEDFQRIYAEGSVKDFLQQQDTAMSSSTYYRKLAQSGILTPKKLERINAAKIDPAVVRRMLSEGKSLKKIAKFYHVADTTIAKHLNNK